MRREVGRFIFYIFLVCILKNYYQVNLVYKNAEKYLNAIFSIHKILLEAQGFYENNTMTELQQIIQSDLIKIFHPDAVNEDTYCLREKYDTVWSSYRRNCFYIDRQRVSQDENHAFQNFKYISLTNEGATKLNQSFMQNLSLFQQSISMSIPKLHKKTMNQYMMMDYRRKITLLNASKICLQDLEIFPNSFLMTNQNQCKAFFQTFYQQSNRTEQDQYLLKTNSHKGQGLRYIDSNLSQNLYDVYDGGKLCGKIMEKQIVQQVTRRPLLVKGRKIDVRIWILIVSQEPLIVYVYNSLLVISCLDYFDLSNLTEQNFICNGAIIKQYLNLQTKGKQNKFTVDDIHLDWSLQKLNQYFIDQQLISDKKWWKTKLLPQIQRKVAYFLHINMPKAQSDPRIAGVFAFDASIDVSGDIRLLDFNTGPNFSGYSKYSHQLLVRMNTNVLSIIKNYQRKRYQKFRSIIDKIVSNEIQSIQEKEFLDEILHDDPISSSFLSNFYLINFTQSFRNCKKFDRNLL